MVTWSFSQAFSYFPLSDLDKILANLRASIWITNTFTNCASFAIIVSVSLFVPLSVSVSVSVFVSVAVSFNVWCLAFSIYILHGSRNKICSFCSSSPSWKTIYCDTR